MKTPKSDKDADSASISHALLASDLMKEWRRASPQKLRSMMRSLIGAHRYEFIGEFMIVDAAVIRSTGTAIMHLPSGRCRTNSMPIEEGIRAAKAMTPEQAADTVQWLHEC